MLVVERLPPNTEVSRNASPPDRMAVKMSWWSEVFVSGALMLLSCNFSL